MDSNERRRLWSARRGVDPPEAEIRELADRIRETWSDQERARRCVLPDQPQRVFRIRLPNRGG